MTKASAALCTRPVLGLPWHLTSHLGKDASIHASGIIIVPPIMMVNCKQLRWLNGKLVGLFIYVQLIWRQYPFYHSDLECKIYQVLVDWGACILPPLRLQLSIGIGSTPQKLFSLPFMVLLVLLSQCWSSAMENWGHKSLDEWTGRPDLNSEDPVFWGSKDRHGSVKRRNL